MDPAMNQQVNWRQMTKESNIISKQKLLTQKDIEKSNPMQMHGKHHVEVGVNRVGYTEYQDERKKIIMCDRT